MVTKAAGLREGAGLRANAAPVRARYQRFELKLASGQLDDSQRESHERAMEQAP